MDALPRLWALIKNGEFAEQALLRLERDLDRELRALQPSVIPQETWREAERAIAWEFPRELPEAVPDHELTAFRRRLEADAEMMVEVIRCFEQLDGEEIKAWTDAFDRLIEPQPRGRGRELYFALARFSVYLPLETLQVRWAAPHRDAVPLD